MNFNCQPTRKRNLISCCRPFCVFFICYIVLCGFCSARVTKVNKPELKCTVHSIRRMLGAECYSLELEEIPRTLDSGIKILDVTRNRIRVLKNDSFTRYRSLEMLYLSDNAIAKISDGCFDSNSALEVLDISKNSLSFISPSILRLPSLKRLYLSDNLLQTADVMALPNAAFLNTLELLAIADCEITNWPTLEAFPLLKLLNLSGNSITNFNVDKIASMCRLNILDLSRNYNIDKDCDCFMRRKWCAEKSVQLLISVNCTETHESCASKMVDHNNLTMFGNLTRENIMFAECDDLAKRLETNSIIWWLVGAGVVAVIVVIGIVWWRCSRRRGTKEKRRKKLQEITESMPTIKEENGKELLNDD